MGSKLRYRSKSHLKRSGPFRLHLRVYEAARRGWNNPPVLRITQSIVIEIKRQLGWISDPFWTSVVGRVTAMSWALLTKSSAACISNKKNWSNDEPLLRGIFLRHRTLKCKVIYGADQLRNKTFVFIGHWWIIIEPGTYELKDSLWNVVVATSRNRIPTSFLGHLFPVVERNSRLRKWFQKIEGRISTKLENWALLREIDCSSGQS